MQWIRLFLSCLLFESVTGSLAYAVVWCRKRLFREKDYLFELTARKAAFLMYIPPITFLYVYLSRIRPAYGLYVVIGDFIKGMVPGMCCFFGILWIVWLTGLVTAIFRCVRKSEAVCDRLSREGEECCEKYQRIFSEYQDRFPEARLALYQNRMISSPLSVYQNRKNMIFLPDRFYTEKELRMILEHEVNHITTGDLRWRRLGLSVVCVHWFNPVVYRQFRDLIAYQEIVCDLRSSMEKPWYTKKEYATLLAVQTAPDLYLPESSSFAEKKEDAVRRIEIMAKVKKFRHMKKKTMTVCSACLVGIALIPSLAFASASATLQEKWMHAEAPQDWGNGPVEEYGTFDDKVAEIYVDIARINRRTNDFAEDINEDTRVILQEVQMTKGSTIAVSADCEDADAVYRLGIKNADTETLRYIEGQGHLHYVFSIKKAGYCEVYVENCGDRSVQVRGHVYCSD